MFVNKKRIHFIGIGGAGMCPMAEVMAQNGYTVSGSDMQQTAATKRLESLHIRIQYHHDPDLIRERELCVYSSAIKEDNPELAYARDHGITCMKRAAMLGDIMRAYFSIGVAGTHGKTTTTSLIGNVFRDAGKDPMVIVGGAFRESESNAIVGGGRLLIAEADEYDRSFLHMFPAIAVVTNIEVDHLDIYTDLSDIIEAFVEYVNKVPFYGMVVVCADDAVTTQIIPRINRTCMTYGTSELADYRAEAIRFEKSVSEFTVYTKNRLLGTITLPLSGLHNIRNALAAVAVASEMDISFSVIKQSLESFSGIKRRFEIMGSEKEITVIDDYAHHPSEIAATLSAAKQAGFTRLIAVFQPHLYSRTRDFCGEFAQSLAAADMAVVTEIYKAREEPINGVRGMSIIEKMHEQEYANTHFVKKIEEIPELLTPLLQPGDGVILMGAGDIGSISRPLLERIQHG
jgi:UDP-N-acetylmuramate--alanine ligase